MTRPLSVCCCFIFGLLAFLLAVASPALARWSVTTSGGTAWNVPLPLVIRQQGYPDIRIPRAVWETRPLYESPYYAVRIDNGRWGVEVIHHKLYLVTPHDDIQQFWITHGYNLILVERLETRGSLTVVYGLGSVLAHPETIVRELELSDPPHAEISLKGYYVSGLAAHMGAAYQASLLSWLAVVAEGKFTAAWARVPVAKGHADVPNAAFHGVVGLRASW